MQDYRDPSNAGADMLKVRGRRNSFNVQKVMWLIGELELAHEHIDAGGKFGGLDLPDFLAMNPHGRVPRARHDSIRGIARAAGLLTVTAVDAASAQVSSTKTSC